MSEPTKPTKKKPRKKKASTDLMSAIHEAVVAAAAAYGAIKPLINKLRKKKP